MAPELQTAFHEKHYSLIELATIWNLSRDTVKRMFEHEPGVIPIGTPKKGKRRYVVLRIPESVALRVYRRMAK